MANNNQSINRKGREGSRGGSCCCCSFLFDSFASYQAARGKENEKQKKQDKPPTTFTTTTTTTRRSLRLRCCCSEGLLVGWSDGRLSDNDSSLVFSCFRKGVKEYVRSLVDDYFSLSLFSSRKVCKNGDLFPSSSVLVMWCERECAASNDPIHSFPRVVGGYDSSPIVL